MRNLWRAFKLVLPHKWMMFWYFISALILALVSSAPLVLIKTFLDKISERTGVKKDRLSEVIDGFLLTYFPNIEHYIMALCAIILGLWMVKALADFVNSYLSSWLAQRLRMEAMQKVMNHLLALDVPYFDKHKTGDLVSRMVSDGENLRKTIKIFLDFLRQPPQILSLAAVALYYDWRLFLIGAIGVPLIIFPAQILIKNISKQTKKYQQKTANVAQAMLQNLGGIRIIFAYDAAKQEGSSFAKMTESLFRTGLRRNMSRSIQRPLTELMLGVGLVGVLLYGGLQSLKTPGYIHNFLAFVGAMGMLYGPLRAMMATTVEMSELLPSAERTFEVLDLKPVIAQAPDAVECPKLKHAIEFKDVTFGYPGRGNVFDKLNLTIRAGEKIGIVGPTGVGKSTMLSLLMRFYDPPEGQVCIDGVDIKKSTLSSLRSQMAFVNQRPFLFHDSVMENIRYGRADATDEEVMEAARKAMVHDEIMAQPEGYKTLCGERGGELFSGGQGQRICVARAILRQASILLLDEATSSLDTFSERRVQDALDKLVENCTSVIVAHRLSTLRNVDRIVVFGDKGGIEAIGPHEELLKSSATYRKLWSEQSNAFSVAGE